jgi:O-6-methylguanine DNA methyltransferase
MFRTVFSTALGECSISWNERGISRFQLPPARAVPTDSRPTPEIEAVIERVRRHLAGQCERFNDLSYDLSLLSAFQAAVLRAALAIPAGQTRTYGQIAAAIGQPPVASRQVGGALGANPIPLLIPCHRIVGANGKMTGFSAPGGIETKLKLLALEGAQLFSQ